MHNPWREAHAEAEAVFQDSPAIASGVVALEYEGTDELALECPRCDGTLFYKATIGALKCPTCGLMADTQGQPYEDDPRG